MFKKVTSKKPETIEEYINAADPKAQVVLKKFREIVKKEVPQAREKISYGIPTFFVDGHAYFLYIAAWKNHISIYPIPRLSQALNAKLKDYISGKGTLKFPLSNSMPYDLISEVVKARAKEIF